MKTTTKTLLCGALLASVLPAVEQSVQADPGDMIFLTALWNPTSSGALSVSSSIQAFGTSFDHEAFTGYPIHISTGLSQRPGWTYEANFDYIDFDPGFALPAYNQLIIYMYVKAPGANPISGIEVKDGTGASMAYTGALELFGGTAGLATDGSAIAILVDVQTVIDTGFLVTVQWNQVPAPGALALLGVAGLVGKRRRRN